MQEGVERNGGVCRYWSQVTAENWWERGRWERGKLHIETRMNARSCWDEKQGLDIESKWRCVQEAVRGRGGEAEILNPHECGKLLRSTGDGNFRRPQYNGIRYKTKWMQEVTQGHQEYWSKMNAVQEVVEGHHGGSLDFNIKWRQEIMGRLRRKYRYWNPMNGGSLGSLMRGTGGEVRYWNQMSARSCWETRGEA